MENQLDPEITLLMQKYADGKIPPLVDLVEPDLGLIDKDILERYLRGTMDVSKFPLGILLAAEGYNTVEEKWLWGDFELNEWANSYWPAFCKNVRALGGDQVCEDCDRRRAAQAEHKGGVITYLCDNGLIDFAAPVKVNGNVVAVLFSGQYKPREEALWNPSFIETNGLFNIEGKQGRGVNAWEESQRRIQKFAKERKIPAEELEKILSDPDLPVNGLSPNEVPHIQAQLARIAGELSHLATTTYESEKGRVINYIQNRIAQSLRHLSNQPIENRVVWEALSAGIDLILQFFELNYALVLSCRNQNESIFVHVLCHAGRPAEFFGMGNESQLTNSESVELKKTCELGERFKIDLRKHKQNPFFGKLLALHESKPNKMILAIPIPGPPKAAPLTLLLGKFKQEFIPDRYHKDDQDALERFTNNIEMVTKSILLVDQFDQEVRNRNRFLEDIAHDIRNPIQNMIVTSEVLPLETLPIETKQKAAKSLAAQARHLDMMSKRIWTLSKIDAGKLDPETTRQVHVYQTLTEIRKSLLVLAEKRRIDFTINKILQDWRPIVVNYELFFEAALNLSENAIKYSRDGTEIKVYGEFLPQIVTLTWENRGIQVREEDKERIFDRYYRSAEALRHTQVGRGIGLFIVKTFIDECKGRVEVSSVPITGSNDFLTRFTLVIPLRW